MCVSCGCAQVSEHHGDSRNITLEQLDQAAQAAHTTREQVVQNIMQATTQKQTVPAKHEDASSLVKTSGRHPGDYSPPLGQESGSDWQESQQMGQTGHGGVQKP